MHHATVSVRGSAEKIIEGATQEKRTFEQECSTPCARATHQSVHRDPVWDRGAKTAQQIARRGVTKPTPRFWCSYTIAAKWENGVVRFT